MIISATLTDLLTLSSDQMNLSGYQSRMYEVAGLYDLVLGIPLMIVPGLLFDLFGVDYYSPRSPFVLVTASALTVMGILLLNYADRALFHKGIGYGSALIRLYYSVLILIYSFSVAFHWLFLVLAITDGLTGVLLIAVNLGS